MVRITQPGANPQYSQGLIPVFSNFISLIPSNVLSGTVEEQTGRVASHDQWFTERM
jgi:hypothetical protein